MFCQKCSLHYPDHLSFCRRCGQSLVRSNSETVTESYCCTRCGARIVRGENFCQHCGNRVGITLQETVIGACYHCGTSWRSGWLFCKNCGLDRKRALLLSTSTPSPGSAKIASQPPEEFSEIAKTKCKSCGTEAKPYSRFCEACGANLDGVNNSNLANPSVATAAQAQPEIPSSRLRQADSPRATGATVFEPPATSMPQTNNEVQPDNLEARNNLSDKQLPMTGTVASEAQPPAISHNEQTVVESAGKSLIDNTDSPNKTVVTPLPPFGGAFRKREADSLQDFWTRNRTTILQSVVLIALVVLMVGVVFWWMNRSDQPALEEITSNTGPAQASNQQSTGVSPSTETVSSSAPAGMVYVPGGTFEMGRDGYDEYERPAHKITVNPFFIDITEVTNEEYQRFVNETGHRAPTHWQGGKFPVNEARLPVVNVSWDDANAYAKWAKKRLPTEAEWEFAARGTDGRIYPWGNNWNPAAGNAGRENGGRISEVGRFPNGASPFGALDMCGNVWEWTSSNLLSYIDAKEIAPGKVIRGGAFDAPSARATTTYRGVLPPDRLREKTGFRTVRDVK